MGETYDCVVIGGGLHGCSAALHLALAGLKPVVVEQSYVGRHASGVNAGGVRRLGRDVAEIPLSVASMEIWYGIEDLVGDHCGFEASGQIKVAENEADLATLQERAAEVRLLGYDHEELVDGKELRELVPAIARHCVGGLIARTDGHANPYRTTLAFKRRGEQLGVRFFENTTAIGLEREGESWCLQTSRGAFRGKTLVNCAGAWGGTIAGWLGEPVPIKAEAPMLMVTERVAPFLTQVIGATGRALSFKQVDNGTVIIGGGHRGRAYPAEQASTLDFRELGRNARTAFALFPRMRDVHVVRAWAGIEGMLPDGIPVLGPSGTADNVYHAFGFCAHGFQLGPASGRVIAELIVHGNTNIPIESFRSDRFNDAR